MHARVPVRPCARACVLACVRAGAYTLYTRRLMQRAHSLTFIANQCHENLVYAMNILARRIKECFEMPVLSRSLPLRLARAPSVLRYLFPPG